MNAGMRRAVFVMLAALVIATVAMIEQAAQPERAEACPVCVVGAGIGLYEIVGAGLLAGGSVGAGIEVGHILNNSADTARTIARHPHRYHAAIARMRLHRVTGRVIWRNVHHSLHRLWRFIRHRATLHHIHKRGPGAVWACGVAGITSYLLNQRLSDAVHACIGAGVGYLLGSSKAKLMPKEAVGLP